jgi:hypothetical protein
MTIEKSSPEELLAQFKERYQTTVAEIEKLKKGIQENEAVALKLLGAIETLSYLNGEEVTEEPVDSEEAPQE